MAHLMIYKEMMKNIPDRASWVNILGVSIMIACFVGVAAVFLWAIVDTVKFKLSFMEAFIRFFVITEVLTVIIPRWL